MRKLLVLILLIFLVSVPKAQITLDSTNFPLPATYFQRYYGWTDTIGTSGTDIHYDFAGAGIASSDTLFYLAASSTDFSSKHPGASVARLFDYGDTKFYYYYSRSSEAYWESGVTIIGDFDNGIDTVHGNNSILMGDTLVSEQYSYGYSTVQHSVVSVPINLFVSVEFNKVKEITVDGWGSLSTPFNEFPTVVRVKYVEYKYDSVFIEGNFYSVKMDTITYYNYFTKKVRHPIITAHINKHGKLEYIEMLKIPKVISGCTDPDAINYNPFANEDNGSCFYCDAFNYQVTPDTSICPGETVVLNVIGGNGQLWSTGDTGSSIVVAPVSDMVFSVLVNNGPNCWEQSAIHISVLSQVQSDFWVNTSSVSTGDSVQFINASENATQYIWLFGDTLPEMSNAMNPKYLFSTAGINSVTLIANNTCFTDTTTYPIYVTTIGSMDQSSSILAIFPNPGGQDSFLDFYTTSKTNSSFFITDSYGRIVFFRKNQWFIDGKNQIPVGEICRYLPEGLYLISLTIDGNNFTTKWIKATQ